MARSGSSAGVALDVGVHPRREGVEPARQLGPHRLEALLQPVRPTLDGLGAGQASGEARRGTVHAGAAQAGTGAASTSFTRFGSIRIPGVIVAEIAALLTYRPLAAAGFARRSSSTTAR